MLLTIDELCYRTGMSVKEFIERGATNFKFWVESLFDYKIEPFHLEWVSLFYNNKRSCVIAARQHGKSSVLGPLFHLWMAFYEENKNFMIVSHNLPLSTRHIRDMRNMIAEVELLQYRLEPEDKRRSWTKTEIETATGCKIFCKPYSDNVRGYAALHYCLIDEASYLEDHLIFERAILPMLSHYDGNLMLIGCLAVDTPILLANGLIKPLCEIKAGDKVVGLDHNLKQRALEVIDVIDNGEQELFEVDVGGFKLKATANHPFLTPELQWEELRFLEVGDFVAVPRNFNAFEPSDSVNLRIEEALLIGYVIGDGAIKIKMKESLTQRRGVRGHAELSFFNSDPDIISEFKEIASSLGLKTVEHPKRRGTYRVLAWGYPVYQLLVKLGIKKSVRAQTKFVPEPIIRTSNLEIKAAFLSKLIETDGSVYGGWYSYYTTSKKLAEGVMVLLLQLGVKPWIREREGMGKTGKTKLYEIQVRSRSEVLRLMSLLKWCRKKPKVSMKGNNADRADVIPLKLSVTPEQRWKAMGYNKSISRNKLQRLCNDPKRSEYVPSYYKKLATADIRWVRIRSIRKLGIGPTLNLRVRGGNFVANFIYTHNTPRTEYDLLAKAQLPNSGFVVKRYPAITEEGKPLWPEKFPMSKLERIRKEIGELAFAREYLCTLRGSKERALPPEVLIKSMDENLRMENVGEEGGEYFVGVDLAASPIGDYTVFTVVRKKDGKFVVSRIERYRGIDYKTQCRLIESIYNRFKPRAVLIDKSSFGDMLINELRVEYNVPCEGVAFNPQSRNMLLTKMINLFLDPQGSRVVIPRDANDPYTISLTDVLIHELSGLYPDKTRTGLDTYKTVTRNDDCIMSLALALYAAEQTKTARVYVRAQ